MRSDWIPKGEMVHILATLQPENRKEEKKMTSNELKHKAQLM